MPYSLPLPAFRAGGTYRFAGPRLGEVMAPDANSFGVIRLAMALAVLVSHSYLFQTGTSRAEPLHGWTGHSLGEHAVQVFFILSGILVAQSLDRSRDILDFAWGRFLRIFPGLVVCVLLTAFVLGPWLSTLAPGTYLESRTLWLYLVKTLSLSTGSAPLPGLFETLPLAGLVNMSLWTLKFEVLCYAFLGLAGLAGLFSARWRNRSTLLLAAVLCVIFVDQPKAIETYSTADNVRYFALFFGTGVLAYLLRDRIVINPFALLPLAGVFALALGTRFGELGTALLLGYATLVVASLDLGPLRALTNRYDLSYGVYIYAGPIQQGVLWTNPGIDPVKLTLVSLLVVLPLALLSWMFVEHPALGLRRRKVTVDLQRGLTARATIPQPARSVALGRLGRMQAALHGSEPLPRREPRFGHRRRAR